MSTECFSFLKFSSVLSLSFIFTSLLTSLSIINVGYAFGPGGLDSVVGGQSAPTPAVPYTIAPPPPTPLNRVSVVGEGRVADEVDSSDGGVSESWRLRRVHAGGDAVAAASSVAAAGGRRHGASAWKRVTSLRGGRQTDSLSSESGLHDDYGASDEPPRRPDAPPQDEPGTLPVQQADAAHEAALDVPPALPPSDHQALFLFVSSTSSMINSLLYSHFDGVETTVAIAVGTESYHQTHLVLRQSLFLLLFECAFIQAPLSFVVAGSAVASFDAMGRSGVGVLACTGYMVLLSLAANARSLLERLLMYTGGEASLLRLSFARLALSLLLQQVAFWLIAPGPTLFRALLACHVIAELAATGTTAWVGSFFAAFRRCIPATKDLFSAASPSLASRLVSLVSPPFTTSAWVGYAKTSGLLGLVTTVELVASESLLVLADFQSPHPLLAGDTAARRNAQIQVTVMGIALNVIAFLYTLGGGVTYAVTSTVGAAVGANRPQRARRHAFIAYLTAISIALLSLLVFYSNAQRIATWFSRDADVQAVFLSLLPTIAFVHLVDMVQSVGQGVGRGIGRPATVSAITIVSLLVVGVPLSLFLSLADPPADAAHLPTTVAVPLTVVRGLLLGHGVGFASLGVCLFVWSWRMLR